MFVMVMTVSLVFHSPFGSILHMRPSVVYEQANRQREQGPASESEVEEAQIKVCVCVCLFTYQ